MIGSIIFGLISFLIVSGLIYLILYLPTQWIIKRQKLKVVRLTLSILIGLFITIYFSISPTGNNKTATIQKVGDQYLVTVTGKRLLMVHDPISLLKRETYLDTFKVTVPRIEGVIDGQEIPTEKGYYKMLGTIVIDGEQMKIDLYYDNFGDKVKDPLSWNGEYKVKLK
jgi:hypothetical protein